MRRRDTFIRSQLLAKIEGETSKARGLLGQRAELQEQRKRANMCGHDHPRPDSLILQTVRCMQCLSAPNKCAKLQKQRITPKPATLHLMQLWQTLLMCRSPVPDESVMNTTQASCISDTWTADHHIAWIWLAWPLCGCRATCMCMIFCQSFCIRLSFSRREASFQRQRLLQAVERVQAAKNFLALASGNLDAFLS